MNPSRDFVSILALAVLLDMGVGEPPRALHPVVWMGQLLNALERWAPTQPRARLAYGALVGLVAPAVWAVLAVLAQRALPWPLQALVLKPTFAGRALLEAGGQVERALLHDDLPGARLALGALVSRPTADLDSGLAAAAAIESLAENVVDSWLAPQLAYALGGLPLAYAYRAANTADAMWGYRGPPYEHLGKASARLDDALNWLPARLACVLICAVSGTPRRAAQVWRRDASRTASPNAGQSIAAAAGGLDVRLEKVGQYVLNTDGPVPTAADVGAARRLVQRAMLGVACVTLALCAIRQHR
jgi:adenosylcobinamide-phosphate synthase